MMLLEPCEPGASPWPFPPPDQNFLVAQECLSAGPPHFPESS